MSKKSLFMLLLIIIPVYQMVAESPFFAVKGKVKSYTKTEYVISQKFGDYFRTPNVLYTYKYDDKGRETECLEMSANGTLLSKTVNSYDEKGILTSIVSTDGSNVAEWRIAYTYNEEGLLVDESEFNKNDELSGRTITKYSEDKSRIEESSYNEKGELIWKNICKFDVALNRKLEEKQYFADGALDQKLAYIYNDEGLLTEIDSSDSKGNVTKKTLFRFNEKGQNTETATYNIVTGTEEREMYRYDEAGENIVRVTVYNVANKFDTVVNELVGMSEYKYEK